jgi:DNA-binding transcriptional MocR family regulator
LPPLLGENESKILDLLKDYSILSAPAIAVKLSLDYNSVVAALQLLQSRQYIQLNTEKTNTMVSYQARITARGRRSIQTSESDSSPSQSSLLGASDGAHSEQVVPEEEIQRVVSDLSDAIDSQNGMDDYLRGDLKRKLSDLAESLQRKDRKRFESVKSVIIALAPFLAQTLSKPEMQQRISKIFR